MTIALSSVGVGLEQIGIQPGETLEISVSLMAPTTAGSYGASFRLQNDKGYNFGATLTVIVTVK
jgi:hypothetical protein